MNTSTDQSKLSKIEKLIVFGLILILLANIINRIVSSPFDFDEGVGLILSKIILQTGKYATYENTFDPIVTVGPTVYYPTALALASGNLFFPRVVILIYSLLLISVVFFKYLKNNLSQIIFLCLLCLTPYYYYFSAHVLGEIPAIFFSLTGLYLLDNKRYFLSGVFLTLAIITKNIFLLSAIPTLFLLYTQRNEINFKKLIIFISPFFLIGGAWEIYKLISYNFSLNSYFDNLYQLLRYNKTLTKPHLEYFPERLTMLSGTFGINGLLFLISITLFSIYSFFKNKSYLLKAIALFVLIYLGYYFLAGSTAWYRHFFPAIVLFTILLADFLPRLRLSSLSTISILIAIFVNILFPLNNSQYLYQQNLLPLFDQTGKLFFEKSNILNQQLQTANFISSHLENTKISGVVWYNAPEISFLANKQIFRIPEDKDVLYLISHPFGRLLVPSVDVRISEYPSKIIVLDTPLYKIYKKND